MRWLDPSRIARLRQKQELSFVPIFFHRPLAILLLIPLADVAWITPNLLTVLNILLRLVVAAILWPEAFGGLPDASSTIWIAVVLWNLGGVLDAADGTLARYRNQSTLFGRFFDKVSDRVVTLSLVTSLAARAYVETHSVRFVFLGMVYLALMSATSVAKWIEYALVVERTDGSKKVLDPGERKPPERTPWEWLKYLVWSLRFSWIITEMDFPLWGSLALLFGRLDLLFYALGFLAAPYAMVMLSLRGIRIFRTERAQRSTPA